MVQQRVLEAGRQVRCTRYARCNADTKLSRELRVDKGRHLLVPRLLEIDFAFHAIERAEHAVDTVARVTEDVPQALNSEIADAVGDMGWLAIVGSQSANNRPQRRFQARLSPRAALFAPAKKEPSSPASLIRQRATWRNTTMDGIIYLVGLIVVIMAILSLFGPLEVSTMTTEAMPMTATPLLGSVEEPWTLQWNPIVADR